MVRLRKLKKPRMPHIDNSPGNPSFSPNGTYMNEIGLFLSQLNFRIKKFLSTLFRRSDLSPAVDPKKGKSAEDAAPAAIFDRSVDPLAQQQPFYFESRWHEQKSMVVNTRVVEATPPVGYLKVLQILREQISVAE